MLRPHLSTTTTTILERTQLRQQRASCDDLETLHTLVPASSPVVVVFLTARMDARQAQVQVVIPSLVPRRFGFVTDPPHLARDPRRDAVELGPQLLGAVTLPVVLHAGLVDDVADEGLQLRERLGRMRREHAHGFEHGFLVPPTDLACSLHVARPATGVFHHCLVARPDVLQEVLPEGWSQWHLGLHVVVPDLLLVYRAVKAPQ